ncbi:MAG: hypothetical protein JW769_01135 [Parachlamydiales bacterium]|nr:hypothetical protein [Parachlamydiales bacterium]
MNEKSLKDFFNKLLKEPDSFGSFENIVMEVQKFFHEFIQTFQEASEEEQKKLQKAIVEVSEQLQHDIEKACVENGVDIKELQEMFFNEANYSSGEWNALQNLKTDVENTSNKRPSQKVKKARKHTQKQWLSA